MSMQSIKETIRCTRCGCLALPDAIKCPKCGADYRDSNRNGSKEIIDPFSYLSASRIEKVDSIPSLSASVIKVIRAHYQLICPRHGQINVRATVIGSPVKCPFCE
jgi:hypothetical protein